MKSRSDHSYSVVVQFFNPIAKLLLPLASISQCLSLFVAVGGLPDPPGHHRELRQARVDRPPASQLGPQPACCGIRPSSSGGGRGTPSRADGRLNSSDARLTLAGRGSARGSSETLIRSISTTRKKRSRDDRSSNCTRVEAKMSTVICDNLVLSGGYLCKGISQR
jgi:hypothetical protein